MKRQFNPAELELMDQPQPVSAELESDLENIRELNRWFGSYALISMFLGPWIKPGARLRIVDLATGSGDIPRLIMEYGRKVGAELRIDAVDQQSATLEIAKRLSVRYPEITFVEGDVLEWQPTEPCDIVFRSELRIDAVDQQSATLEIAKRLSVRYPEITFVEGDVLEWQPTEPCDIVFCTMALHHFSEADAVRLLQHCCKLSRKSVLVSDLRRSWIATIGVHL